MRDLCQTSWVSRWLGILLLVPVLLACRDLVEYSPYEVPTGELGLTENNLAALAKSSQHAFQPFRFVAIADTHTYYDQLEEAVASIRQRSDVDFVLVAGDLTDYGYLREFEWTIDILQRLDIPWLVVSGNHDALNNGKTNFARLFGAQDYAFSYNGVRFIAFNSNSWEFDNRVPRLDWLQAALADSYNYPQVIALTHISPLDDERFTNTTPNRYLDLIRDNNVSLLIAGHDHATEYYAETRPNGGLMRILINGTVKDHHYHLIDVGYSDITIHEVVY